MNKFNQFQSVVYTKNFDIICVTETWLNNTVFNNEILPTSYTIYRKDRVNRGGGVLVAIHNSIPSQLCHTSNSIEMISVHLNIRPKLLLYVFTFPQTVLVNINKKLYMLFPTYKMMSAQSYLGISIPLTLTG